MQDGRHVKDQTLDYLFVRSHATLAWDEALGHNALLNEAGKWLHAPGGSVFQYYKSRKDVEIVQSYLLDVRTVGPATAFGLPRPGSSEG